MAGQGGYMYPPLTLPVLEHDKAREGKSYDKKPRHGCRCRSLYGHITLEKEILIEKTIFFFIISYVWTVHIK
jgi:hypothetical protein